MRRLALASAGLMLLGGLTACGGSPDDASKGDFCNAFKKVGKTGSSDFKKFQDTVAEFGDVGTPKEISDDARKGFEFLIDKAGSADNEKDFKKVGDNLSKDEEKQIKAFSEYAAKTCS